MRPNAMGLDRKSDIRDPASRIRCRTELFSLFINDITSVNVSCRYHLYADDVQLLSAPVLQIILIVSVDSTSTLTIYYSDHCETASQSTRPNLRSWWLILSLLQLDDACQILLDGNTIDFQQKVKKLGLILTWGRGLTRHRKYAETFFSMLLWPMSQLTPSSHSSCIVMLFFPSPHQDCLNA
jgi:hypothetical protein